MRKLSRVYLLFLLSVLSSVCLAEDISTVIAEGMGRDVESATQRAAEAALTQVVGSFIDSSKMVEKRKVIRDGIKSQTKNISSKISEYSQGSIQSIEVLDAIDEDGLIRVSAKVSVRIEDFEHYIRESVLAEKKVKKGLLSKIKIKNKQSESATDLVVEKILKDIISYQVIDPAINGEIEEVIDLDRVEIMDKLVHGEGYIVKIPVKASLRSNFLKNATRILDEVAENKYEGYSISQAEQPERLYAVLVGDFVYDSPETSDRKRIYKYLHEMATKKRGKGLYYGLIRSLSPSISIKNPEMLSTYIFPERASGDLCKATEMLGKANYVRMFAPNIKVSFLSESGNVLREEILTVTGSDYSPDGIMSSYSFVAPPYKTMHRDRFGNSTPILLSYISKNREGHECMVYIDTDTEYSIITKVSEEVLGNTEKVTLKYIAPKLNAVEDPQF